MTVARRGRSVSVLGFLLAGAVGIISSTQTWLTVERADGGEAILVPGASAQVLLAPLSLAVLALGAALAIAARPLRVVFAVLAGAAAAFLLWSTVGVLVAPAAAVGPAVTEATGLAGGDALDDLVRTISPSAWPFIALIGWGLLLAASVFALATWRGWKAGGRRYRSESTATGHGDGPVDAVDSWDDLSRGTDPTR
ncbi:Trp biosynthesis-associated membrane protein [Microbacterium sp. 179-I 3D3 NHS]|uniref:Trp biosynthesis-associated membrane protein n=1 Tax=Microbacterium sp. 179-I 3D3 NHS TaxID=3142382 RepID=UPI0039A1D52C